MSQHDEFEKRVQARLVKLREEEAHKRMLYDRTIGGENVPRPNDQFIARHVGPLKSEAQLRKDAENTVNKERDAQRRNERRRQAVEKSLRDHTTRVQEMNRGQNVPDRSARDDQSRKGLQQRVMDRLLQARREQIEQRKNKDRDRGR